MLTYPFAARGICISIVATQVIAASIDATTSFFAEKVKDEGFMIPFLCLVLFCDNYMIFAIVKQWLSFSKMRSFY